MFEAIDILKIIYHIAKIRDIIVDKNSQCERYNFHIILSDEIFKYKKIYI